MEISIIVAFANNQVIGKDNQLIWHLPNDLKHFKKITSGHPVIMGRKTFESIGRLLPNRKNIIITRNSGYQIEGAHIFNSIESAVESCQEDEEIFIIGGSEIYGQALTLAKKLYITELLHDFEGDAFFPQINYEEWDLVSEEQGIIDERNKWEHQFKVYAKNQ
ncbi:MAG: dihydrofolate reductase [Bacteroidota bacterium]